MRSFPKLQASKLATILIFVWISSSAHAQEMAFEKYQTLKGIESFYVEGQVDSSAQSLGVTSEAIRGEMSTALSGYGLLVASQEEFMSNPNSITAHVQVDVLTTDRGLVVYSVKTSILESVSPRRRPLLTCSAMTWDSGCFGICSESRLPAIVMKSVREQAMALIVDYRKANK